MITVLSMSRIYGYFLSTGGNRDGDWRAHPQYLKAIMIKGTKVKPSGLLCKLTTATYLKSTTYVCRIMYLM